MESRSTNRKGAEVDHGLNGRSKRPGMGRTARWRALLLLLALPALGTTALASAPVLRVQTRRVMLPLTTIEALDAGRLAEDPTRGAYAVELDVEGGDPGRGWVVTVRADEARFRPETADKPCQHLRWKLDEESEGAWRPLDEHDAIVLESPGGGEARIRLDLAVDLGWETEPGTYSLGVLFRISEL
jgi:hypothetical protein